MSRINTNVTSLIAVNSLNANNNALQTRCSGFPPATASTRARTIPPA